MGGDRGRVERCSTVAVRIYTWSKLAGAQQAEPYVEDWAEDEDEKTEQEDLEHHEVKDAQDPEGRPPEVRRSVAAVVHGGILQYVRCEEPC